MSHSCPRHPEPVRSCYVHCRCRCGGCRAANRCHARERYAANGGHPSHPRKVDADPIRRHVAELQGHGLSLSEIARRAGLPAATVIDLMRSGHPSARRRTADALLAVPIPGQGDVRRAAAEGRNIACIDCGDTPLAGGLRCHPCFAANTSPYVEFTHNDSRLVLTRPPAWAERARCVDADPDTFFGGKGHPVGPAKAICSRCPVKAECLDWAIQQGEQYGVWGGTSPRERLLLLRRSGRGEREAAA